jgi:SAM-dependent methyltransferase
MRDEAAWRPSKFLIIDGRLKPSTDPKEVGIGSRLITLLIAEAYQSAIKSYAKGHLLDLGCGKAPLYAVYRPHVTSITCIDWTISPHGTSHVDIAADLNAGIPVPSGSVDTVLCTDVLEHIKAPFAFCKEMTRVLSPNGIAIVGVPFMYWLHEEPHDYFRYTKYCLTELCIKNRLQVLHLSAYGGPLAVVLDVIGKNVPTRYREWYLKAALRLYRSRLGRRVDARHREQFPLGYVLVAQRV